MFCEIDLLVNRVKLYQLMKKQPQLNLGQVAKEIGLSKSWVYKWVKRLKAGQQVAKEKGKGIEVSLFLSQSKAPEHTQQKVSQEVEKEILELRDNLPKEFNRIVGPKTILYHLSKKEELIEKGAYLPRSTSTIWRILDRNQRILRPKKGQHQPEEACDPMSEWQIDFKTISSVAPEEGGKKQHVVESLNIIDKGTSLLIASIPRADFHAQTVLIALVDIFEAKGLPKAIRFDRDPRFVASWTSGEFPSALMRFLQVLGIQTIVCPAHRPDKNAYVERFNRNYKQECLLRYLPKSLAEAISCSNKYYYFYNEKRPNQARSCENVPPRVAFPDASTERQLPEIVDPDGWLKLASQKAYKRRVSSNGSIQIGTHRYYISRAMAKKKIALTINAPEKQFQVYDGRTLIKTLPIKGLYHGRMELVDYVDLMCKEALAEARRLELARNRKKKKY